MGMNFEFATANRILFGPGTLREVASIAVHEGKGVPDPHRRMPTRGSCYIRMSAFGTILNLVYESKGNKMRQKIGQDDLKKLIKESVREVLREERPGLCEIMIPHVSKKVHCAVHVTTSAVSQELKGRKRMDDYLAQFQKIQFPTHSGIVYFLEYSKGDTTSPVPFYAGQTSRHIGRFGDYVSAKFSASTDFKVGEAVRYLWTRGYRVVIRYKESNNPPEEEKLVLDTFRRNGYRLLNELKGYKYRVANEGEEREKIHRFIDGLIGYSGR